MRQNKNKIQETELWQPAKSLSPDMSKIQYPSTVKQSKDAQNIYSKLSIGVLRGHGMKNDQNMNRNVNLSGTGNLKNLIFPDNTEEKDTTNYEKL